MIYILDFVGKILTLLFGTYIIGIIVSVIIITILEKLKIIKDLSKEIKIRTKVFSIVLCLTFIFFSLKTFNIGSTQIGHILEKDDYVEQYYIYMFPEDSVSKNYKVTADISSFLDEGRVYYLQRAYFPNGGYITFDNSWGESLEVDEKVSLVDDEGNHWYIKLTKERVK